MEMIRGWALFSEGSDALYLRHAGVVGFDSLVWNLSEW